MRASRAWILLAVMVLHAQVAGADCKDDASAFEAYMRGLERPFELGVGRTDLTLASHKDLTAPPRALTLEVTAAQISDDFEKFDLASLGKVFAVRTRQQSDPAWQKTTPGWTGHDHDHDVVLAFDESVPWSEVVTVAGLANRAGFTHAYFLFARAEQAVPPPHTSLDDVVRDLKTMGERAIALEPARRGFEAACPALRRAFGASPSRTDDSWFRDTFVPGFGKALVACDCKADLAELRSWVFYRLTPVVQTGSVSVDLVKTGKRLALPGKTPWREASKKLVTGAVWPVAR